MSINIKATSLHSPRKRIDSLDFARGLAIFFMVLVHVLDFYAQSNVHETFFGATIAWLGCYPAAPVFMFIMGIFMASSSQSLVQGLKRAMWLFGLGYLLNIIRLVIPMWLLRDSGVNTDPVLAYHTPTIEFFIGDILQFAGLAFAACTLLKYSFPSKLVLLVIMTVIVFLSPFIWDIKSGIPLVDELLKLLWGHKDQGSMFPLFPWLAYPIAGIVFGYQIAGSENHQKLFLFTLLAGIAITISGYLITSSNPEFHIGYFLRSGPGASITNIGIVLIWLSCCYFIVNQVRNNSVFRLLYFWSKNVTTFYIMQWIIIGWCLIPFGFHQLSQNATIVMMLVVLIASDLSTRLWIYLKRNNVKISVNEDSKDT